MRVSLLLLLSVAGCRPACPAAVMTASAGLVSACARAYEQADTEAEIEAVDDVCLPALTASERLSRGGAERLCGVQP